MTAATLTAKGQTTISKTVRNHFGLKNGDKPDFTIEPDGVTMRPINAGVPPCLRKNRHKAPPVGIEEMGGVIADIATPRTVSAIEYLLSLPAGDGTPEDVMARIEQERNAWH